MRDDARRVPQRRLQPSKAARRSGPPDAVEVAGSDDQGVYIVHADDYEPAAAGVVARAAERVQVDRRAQILDAARAVLARQGYAETSMKDIAREAGVAQGLLHYYFESKDDILADVIYGVCEEMMESHRQALAGVADPLEAIVVVTDRAAERCSDPGFCRLLLDTYSLAMSNESFRKRLRPTLDAMMESTTQMVHDIGSALPTPTLIPKEGIALAIVGAMDGIGMVAAMRGEDAGDAYRALKTLFLSFAAMAYVAAGQEPPLTRIAELIAR